MLAGDGLGVDPLHPRLVQGDDRQHAGLDVRADGDDRPVDVADPELAHRLAVGGVGHHGVGELVGILLHPTLVGVDGEHLHPLPHEGLADGGAEAAEPDHEHRRGPTVRMTLLPSQQWVAPPGVGSDGGGC